MEANTKTKCCSSKQCSSKNDSDMQQNVDDPETIAMFATAAILITGFLIVAYVSGPAGLIITLLMLSALGLFYALRSNKSCK